VSTLDREAVEVFSRRPQRTCSICGIRQRASDVERDARIGAALHFGAPLSGTSASYGFPRFSEIAGNSRTFSICAECTAGQRSAWAADGIPFGWNFATGTDLLEISDTAKRVSMILPFSRTVSFCVPTEPPPLNLSQPEPRERFDAEETTSPRGCGNWLLLRRTANGR